MSFIFSDEQNLLRASVAKYLAAEYDFDKRRAAARAPESWRKSWTDFAELGLLAAPLPEAYGGLGGGALETLIIMEEFGKALVVEPYAHAVVACGGLIAGAGARAQKQAHLPAIATGERIVALASAEPRGRYNAAHVATEARKQGAGFVLNGEKAVVIAAPQADHLIVSARTAGGVREAAGITLFLVPKALKGIRARDYQTTDGFQAAELCFDDVSLGAEHVLGEIDGGFAPLQHAIETAIAAVCAEAAGCMREILDLTVDYAKNRKQFGVPIASFQVLQHRMVDMLMATEQAASMAFMAAAALDEGRAERAKAVSAAKAHIGKAARFVGQSAVQIHGGMGVTDEMKVSHCFKRLTMIDTQLGNVDHHLRRYAGLIADAA